MYVHTLLKFLQNLKFIYLFCHGNQFYNLWLKQSSPVSSSSDSTGYELKIQLLSHDFKDQNNWHFGKKFALYELSKFYIINSVILLMISISKEATVLSNKTGENWTGWLSLEKPDRANTWQNSFLMSKPRLLTLTLLINFLHQINLCPQ